MPDLQLSTIVNMVAAASAFLAQFSGGGPAAR